MTKIKITALTFHLDHLNLSGISGCDHLQAGSGFHMVDPGQDGMGFSAGTGKKFSPGSGLTEKGFRADAF